MCDSQTLQIFSLLLYVLVKGFWMSWQKGSILFVTIKIAYVYLLYSRLYNIGAMLLLGVWTTSFLNNANYRNGQWITADNNFKWVLNILIGSISNIEHSWSFIPIKIVYLYLLYSRPYNIPRCCFLLLTYLALRAQIVCVCKSQTLPIFSLPFYVLVIFGCPNKRVQFFSLS